MSTPARISLISYHGKYVSAPGGGGQQLLASASGPGPFETFEVIDLGGDDLVALRAQNGQYLRAEGGHGQALAATGTGISAWEQFFLINLGGGKVGLMTQSGHYVYAAAGGGQQLIAEGTVMGGWQTFGLVDRTPEALSTPPVVLSGPPGTTVLTTYHEGPDNYLLRYVPTTGDLYRHAIVPGSIGPAVLFNRDNPCPRECSQIIGVTIDGLPYLVFYRRLDGKAWVQPLGSSYLVNNAVQTFSWNKDWAQIVSAEMGGGQYLLFYPDNGGVLHCYQLTSAGLQGVGVMGNLGEGWSQLTMVFVNNVPCVLGYRNSTGESSLWNINGVSLGTQTFFGFYDRRWSQIRSFHKNGVSYANFLHENHAFLLSYRVTAAGIDQQSTFNLEPPRPPRLRLRAVENRQMFNINGQDFFSDDSERGALNQQLEVIPDAASGAFRLRTAHNTLLWVDVSGAFHTCADTDRGTYSLFTMLREPGGRFRLRTFHGTFVYTDEDRTVHCAQESQLAALGKRAQSVFEWLDYGQGGGNAYVDGVLGQVQSHPLPATLRPVYRYHHPSRGDYFTMGALPADDPTGWQNQGIAFHAYETQQPGTVEIGIETPSNAPGSRYHFSRRSAQTAQQYGWTQVGRVCYAYLAQQPGSVAVCRETPSAAQNSQYSLSTRSGDEAARAGWQTCGPEFYAYAAGPYVLTRSRQVRTFMKYKGQEVRGYQLTLDCKNALGQPIQSAITLTATAQVVLQFPDGFALTIGPYLPVTRCSSVEGQLSFFVETNDALLCPVIKVKADFMGGSRQLAIAPDQNTHREISRLSSTTLTGYDPKRAELVNQMLGAISDSAPQQVPNVSSDGPAGSTTQSIGGLIGAVGNFFTHTIPSVANDAVGAVVQAAQPVAQTLQQTAQAAQQVIPILNAGVQQPLSPGSPVMVFVQGATSATQAVIAQGQTAAQSAAVHIANATLSKTTALMKGAGTVGEREFSAMLLSAGATEKLLIQSADEAGAFVQQVVAQLGVTANELLNLTTFSWNRILQTQQQVARYVDKMISLFQQTVTELLTAGVDGIKAKIDQLKTILANAMNTMTNLVSGGLAFAKGFSPDSQSDFLKSMLQENLSDGSLAVSTTAQQGEQDLDDLATSLQNQLASFVSQLQTSGIVALLSNPGSILETGLGPIFNVVQAFFNLILDAGKDVVQSALTFIGSQLSSMLQAVQTFFSAPLEIPLLKEFYATISNGATLTLRSLIALLAATSLEAGRIGTAAPAVTAAEAAEFETLTCNSLFAVSSTAVALSGYLKHKCVLAGIQGSIMALSAAWAAARPAKMPSQSSSKARLMKVATALGGLFADTAELILDTKQGQLGESWQTLALISAGFNLVAALINLPSYAGRSWEDTIGPVVNTGVGVITLGLGAARWGIKASVPGQNPIEVQLEGAYGVIGALPSLAWALPLLVGPNTLAAVKGISVVGKSAQSALAYTHMALLLPH